MTEQGIETCFCETDKYSASALENANFLVRAVRRRKLANHASLPQGVLVSELIEVSTQETNIIDQEAVVEEQI